MEREGERGRERRKERVSERGRGRREKGRNNGEREKYVILLMKDRKG